MIIVTGANGFIGSAFIWELNQKGIKNIIAVDPITPELRPEPLKKRQYTKFLTSDQIWDFLNLPSTKKELTWIVHMGACSSTTETNEEYLWQNNTLYSERLFSWCAENNKDFIYASSAATYGAGEIGFDDQTHSEQLKPLNLYGKSKVDMDRWAVLQSQKPNHWYGLKFFNVYGPNEYHKGEQSSVVFKAFKQITQTGELALFKSYRPEYGDGLQMRDFVYVKDVTNWMWELMQKKPKSGIYNMGFGFARTWLDLAKASFAAINKPLKIKWLEMPESIRSHYQYFTEARMQKWLAQGLSKPSWSLEEGIKDYIQNHLQNDDPSL